LFVSKGSDWAAAETCADFLARKTKKPAMPHNMQTMTASKEKIPQLIPLAMGESEAPKQVAQASADGVDAPKIAPSKIETKTNLARFIGS
jgi:hypothetical protein